MGDEDTTMWQRVRKPRREYEGPERRHEPAELMKYWPLLLAIAGGTVGYVETKFEVRQLRKDLTRQETEHTKDMQDYLGWNRSISERLRDLERQ